MELIRGAGRRPWAFVETAVGKGRGRAAHAVFARGEEACIVITQ